MVGFAVSINGWIWVSTEGRPPVPVVPRPNEPLWEVRKRDHVIRCSLRYRGEWGVEVQLFRDGVHFGGMRFQTHTKAMAFAEEERVQHVAEADNA